MASNDIKATRASSAPSVSNETNPSHTVSQSVTDLGVNPAKTMSNGVRSPLTGSNVSMTVAQPYGGPIVSTEQGKVSNQTGPNA